MEGYINQIKNNYFFAGIIEISMASLIFNKNIIIYKTNYNSNQNILNDGENAEYYHLFTTDNDNSDIDKINILDHPILLLFDEQINHYSLLLYNNKKNNIEDINNSKNKINNENYYNKIQLNWKKFLIKIQ